MRQRAKLAGGARPRPADPAARRAVQRHGPAPAAAHDGPAAVDGRGRAATILFSVAHPRGGRAARRRGAGRSYAGRLAASGDFRSIRRLMTDRPHTFTVRSSDDRRAGRGADERAVHGRRVARRRADHRPHRRLRRLHPGRRRRGARGRASGCSRCSRPTSRSRASSATWCANEGRRMNGVIAGITLRQLLGRRRTILLLLLGR